MVNVATGQSASAGEGLHEDHRSSVERWITRASAEPSTRAMLAAFQGALSALSRRAMVTLGGVTVAAIGARVLHHAIERHTFFHVLEPMTIRELRCDQLDLENRLVHVPRDQLVAGMRAVLLEVLTIFGTLTADILTPELHAELAASTPRPESGTRA